MKILVLLDGSMWSQKAALHAMEIAQKKKAEVVLMSVLDIHEAKTMAFNFCSQSGMCDRIKSYEDQIWRDMRRNINEEIAQVLFHYSAQNVACTSKILEGSAAAEIVREAESGGYSLVVMGAHGRNAKDRLGTLSSEVAGKINAPILIVH